MKRFLIAVVAVGAYLANTSAQSVTSTQDDKVIERFDANNQVALQALLRFGFENRIPMGIVLNDRSLCETTIDFKSKNTRLRATLAALISKVPNYNWTIENGTVVLRPTAVMQDDLTLLDMMIPRFAAPAGPLKEQRLYLWMDVRAILRPDEGTILNSLSSEADIKYPPLRLTNMTVEQILNTLVSRPPYGAWILHPIANDLRQAVADSEYVTFLPYGEGPSKMEAVSCSSAVIKEDQ